MPIWIVTVPVSLSDASVLLSGSDGFTGIHLRRRLEEAGARVIPLIADLRDKAAVAAELAGSGPIDYAVHLAAISFVPHGSDIDVYAVNLFGTENLLQALIGSGNRVKKVILAGSANIYGNASTVRIDERQCPAPINHYGISKLAMEHMASQYRDRLPIVIVRPFNYTGRGQADHFLIPKIVSHFIRKSPSIELGNIDVSRDFSDVRWIAEAYCSLLSSPLADGVYNLCSGRAIPLRTIIASLESLSGHTMQIRQNPAFVRSGEIAVLEGDNTRLFTALPELIRPIPFEETLAWMMEGTQA